MPRYGEEIREQTAELAEMTEALREMRERLARMDAKLTRLEQQGPECTGKIVAAEMGRASQSARQPR